MSREPKLTAIPIKYLCILVIRGKRLKIGLHTLAAAAKWNSDHKNNVAADHPHAQAAQLYHAQSHVKNVAQIHAKQYASELKSRGIKKIQLLGIAFEGKNILVKAENI